jgi:hypothetical protein
VTEYVSGALGGKIKAIICEWWKLVEEGAEPAESLKSSTIYERLISQGVEVPDHAMSEILVELAKGGQIKLTMDGRPSRDPRKYGSHDRPQRRTGVMLEPPPRLLTRLTWRSCRGCSAVSRGPRGRGRSNEESSRYDSQG